MDFANDEARNYYNEICVKGSYLHVNTNKAITVKHLKKAERIFKEMNQAKLEEKISEKDLDYYFTNISW
jgi:hypothetical protein